MEIIDQSWSWEQKPHNAVEIIAAAARTCYQSDSNQPAEDLVKRCIEKGHHSVLEHASASIRVLTDRGVTHELVRHRLCAFSQESTRYCNYGGKHMRFIRPVWSGCETGVYEKPNKEEYFRRSAGDDLSVVWLSTVHSLETIYGILLSEGWSPQQARAVLPNSLAAEIVMTANLQEWRHIFSLRCDKAAHPQMRGLMLGILAGFHAEIPVLFDDIAFQFLGSGYGTLPESR